MVGTGWRRRVPLVLVVIACAAGVVAAVSAGTRPTTGLDFLQDGHWVAQPATGQVFHVDGIAKTVDAQAGVAGIEPGSQVVQGPTSGYVVGDSRIVEFGKSSLRVESTITPPTGERPVAVEAAGGPYLVYREAGKVVRLGERAKTIAAGDVLGEPVATPDGTLWLHRVSTGVLCLLPKDADRISCPAAAPSGHTGALTTVGGVAAFVDTTSDVLRRLSPEGLGDPVGIGLDVPGEARVAPADAAGRVAVLDPGGRRLHLLDAAGLDGRPAEPPVTKALPDGEYAAPTASDGSVVLLDEARGALLTYSGDGRQHAETPIPAGTVEPRLFRGEDERVYVDGADGQQVLVVDGDGTVDRVPVVGQDPADGEPGRHLSPPPPVITREPEPPGNDTSVLAEERTSTPERNPQRNPVPASPPGMPPGLAATPQGSTARVTWGAAPPNGAAVTTYHVSWSSPTGPGGGSSTAGNSAVLNGLASGATYTVTVVAENRAGRGTPATTRVTMPRRPVVTVTRGETESYNDTCKAPECGKMRVKLTGFEPSTKYRIRPESTANYDNDGGTYTTDDDGAYSFQAFHFGKVGAQVWIVVEGPNGERYESARYTWESG
ncbi:fibronectin type III domain-containing protein [Saccharopolyspora indica]|uniref:fibronectin type III domain-containing protein n=1 Tax=Saccharopolyspora indica TaxID=1229659 RepID=UPI0022EA34F6|nr:fibronectin type III domain-containing protein [Saccharopolyspora indica]MDA3647189.1 fibronectin type III domain-containing protein [Saccharopolyspora indica]